MHAVEVLQKEIATAQRMRRSSARPLEVLIEGESRGKWYGRTRTNKLVHIASEAPLAGKLVQAQVTQTSPWSMQGDLVEAAVAASV